MDNQRKPFRPNNRGEVNFINDQIRAKSVLLIDEEGNKLGLFTLSEALQKGQLEMKDLVQIGYNPTEQIATAKFMEVGKFLYLQKKHDKDKKKSQKTNLMKEIKFGYNIGENDLKMKINKTIEFLQEGNSVKIIGALRGRENYYKQKMFEKVDNVVKQLEDIGKSQGIKQEANGYSVILFPKGK